MPSHSALYPGRVAAKLPTADPRQRAWARLLSSSTETFSIRRIKVLESEVYESQTVDLDRANVIVGAHSSGKSSFLALVEAALGHLTAAHYPPFMGGQRYNSENIDRMTGVVEVSVDIDGGSFTRVVDLSAFEEERKGIWEAVGLDSEPASILSSASFADNLSFYFQELKACTEEVQHEQALKTPEKAALKNILGRSYDSITVKTIAIDRDWMAPYIIATENGRTFDSTKMSLGELWTHWIRWEQQRWARSTFMLDEPEAFLAARGHRPLIDEVARIALAQDQQILVATHSSGVLSRFPVANMRMCLRGSAGKIRIVRPESLDQVRNAIGLDIPVETIAVVEDEFAKRVLTCIFGFFGKPLGGIEIVASDGASGVIAATRSLASAKRLKVVGVLDGDQKGSVQMAGLTTLPGTRDPETQLLDHALLNPHLISGRLSRSLDAVLAAIDDCRFVEHQYQLELLAKRLGLDIGHVVTTLVDCWLERPEVRDEAASLVAFISDS